MENPRRSASNSAASVLTAVWPTLRILALVILVGLTPGATSGQPMVARKIAYHCVESIEPPVLAQRCGRTVCVYVVSCTDLETGDEVEGEALCPMRGNQCEPYDRCRVPHANFARGVKQSFASQCDRFRTPAAPKPTPPRVPPPPPPDDDDGWGAV